jgi:peptidase C10-like protein/Spi protease inhibitor/type IX secretion system substrate protein
MKKLFSLILFVIAGMGYADGKTIPMSTLGAAAANFLNSKGMQVRSADELSVAYEGVGTYKGAYYTSLYVLSVNGRKGWVMLSADDLIEPVLAYSNESTFDINNIAPATLAWIHGYEKQIAAAIYTESSAKEGTADQWKELAASTARHNTAKTTSVAPLLATTWNQSPYYNDLCPYDVPSSTHVVTGCVATAMVQVMKYWNWPTVGCGYHSYKDPAYGVQTVNFSASAYDWTSMPNSLSGANLAVAKLNYDAGVSVDMYYGVGGSNSMVNTYQNFITPCAEFALKANFHYKKSLYSLYRTGEVPGESPGVGPDSVTELLWISDLKAELDMSRPMIYCGFESIIEGHCWVLDGYTTGNLFHFNWGWGGASNGYYTVDALNPPAIGGPGFNINQTVIMGIEPDSFPSNPGNIQVLSPLTTTQTPAQFGQPFSVSAKIMNAGAGTFSGDFCAQIYDTTNTLQGTLQTYYGENVAAGDSTPLYTFASPGMFNLFPGIYNVRIFYRNSGSATWTPVANNGSFINYTNVSFYNDSDMEITSPLVVTPGTTLTQFDPISVSTNISDVDWANLGNNFYWPHNIFRGNLEATLNKVSDGSVAFTIQTFSGVTIDTDAIVPYTFSNASVTAPPGTYALEIRHQYNGAGNYFLTGSTFFSNPVLITIVNTLSVTNVNNPAAEVNIYPNPATTSLTIAGTGKINSVVISNLIGQVVYNNQYNVNMAQVDVSNLPAGVYLVRINGTEVRKFVKE